MHIHHNQEKMINVYRVRVKNKVSNENYESLMSAIQSISSEVEKSIQVNTDNWYNLLFICE